MKYFDYLTKNQTENIFFIAPSAFNKDSSRQILSHALGATLYMPAIRESIAQEIIERKHKGLVSTILCLEDAIGDNEIHKAEENLICNLNRLHSALENNFLTQDTLPLIFVRVRTPDQIEQICELAGDSVSVLTGFVLPKFTLQNAGDYFSRINKINTALGKRFYVMPILESSDIMYIDSRPSVLNEIADIIDTHRDLILNIRIGATDFSSLFGIRRNYDTTIYDIAVIRDCISDIINTFLRNGREYVISGPVWEYFSTGERVLKPLLRVSPFKETYGSLGVKVREKMLDKYLDGLIHEVLLDKTNGILGKTIIHPSHLLPVQSLHVVSHEEYVDALSIINNNTGDIGVFKSQYSNKMNEIKPHLRWAEKVMIKSKIYGVLNEHQTFANLLSASEYL